MDKTTVINLSTAAHVNIQKIWIQIKGNPKYYF